VTVPDGLRAAVRRAVEAGRAEVYLSGSEKVEFTTEGLAAWYQDELDRHRKMIAEEMRHLAAEHCGDDSIEGNDAPTAYWLADKIEAGGPDAC
jgi:hypothetical protein